MFPMTPSEPDEGVERRQHLREARHETASHRMPHPEIPEFLLPSHRLSSIHCACHSELRSITEGRNHHGLLKNTAAWNDAQPSERREGKKEHNLPSPTRHRQESEFSLRSNLEKSAPSKGKA